MRPECVVITCETPVLSLTYLVLSLYVFHPIAMKDVQYNSRTDAGWYSDGTSVLYVEDNAIGPPAMLRASLEVLVMSSSVQERAEEVCLSFSPRVSSSALVAA